MIPAARQCNPIPVPPCKRGINTNQRQCNVAKIYQTQRTSPLDGCSSWTVGDRCPRKTTSIFAFGFWSSKLRVHSFQLWPRSSFCGIRWLRPKASSIFPVTQLAKPLQRHCNYLPKALLEVLSLFLSSQILDEIANDYEFSLHNTGPLFLRVDAILRSRLHAL